MDKDEAKRMRRWAQNQIKAANRQLRDLGVEVEDDEVSDIDSSNAEQMDEGAAFPPTPEPSPLRDKILIQNPERRCVAIKYRTGEQCRNFAISGGTVCKYHGGATNHVKNAARIRVENHADRLMRVALEFAYDESKSEPVRLKAIQDLLDRAGLKPTTSVAVGHVTEFERLEDELRFSGVATVTREDSRAARGLDDDQAQSIEDLKRTLNSASSSGGADTASDEPAPALVDDDTGSPRPQEYGAVVPGSYAEPSAPYLRPNEPGAELEPIDAEIVYPDNELTGDEAMAVAATYVRSQRAIAGPRQQRALPRGRST